VWWSLQMGREGSEEGDADGTSPHPCPPAVPGNPCHWPGENAGSGGAKVARDSTAECTRSGDMLLLSFQFLSAVFHPQVGTCARDTGPDTRTELADDRPGDRSHTVPHSRFLWAEWGGLCVLHQTFDTHHR
jgi:hypothetical protein